MDSLFLELEKRFKKDQELCKKGFGREYVENCYENSEWLKRIVSQQGWPSDDKIGTQGELYAWLIVQHSDDVQFQKQCLQLLKELPETEERKKHIAYLTDRILVKEGKKQIYGTQFQEDKPSPILDEKNLDERRKAVGLNPFEEYCQLMKK